MRDLRSDAGIPADRIREQCDRILASKIFARSLRQRAFLDFVVSETLDGKSDRLKEYALGVEVFEKDSDFDPGVDSIVRVEASRLRSKLREYYAEEGSTDSLLIEIPKGHYSPSFSLLPEAEAEIQTKPRSTFVRTTAISLLLVAITVFSFSKLSPPPTGSKISASVAVLPFLNMSDDASQEYFSDGISEELLNVLSRVPELRVSSRTSSFTFKDANRNIPEISKILGVSHIVEGSVRKAGNRVRITAQLIETADDRHLWSNSYDRELNDIFQIQDEISEAIVFALRDTLGIESITPVELDQITENVDAFDLYLQAAELNTVVTLESANRRIELLEQAVSVDPTFAKAWAALSSAIMYVPTYDHSLNALEYRVRARHAAEQALSLDPEESRAHMAMAVVLADEYNWREWYERQPKIKQLTAGDKNAAVEGLVQSGYAWMGLGYIGRALADGTAGLDLQSDNADLHLISAMALLNSGRRGEALPHLEQALLLGFTGSASDQLWEYVDPVNQQASWAATMTMYLKVYEPELLRLLPHLKRIHFAPVDELEAERRRFWLIANELGISEDYLLSKSSRWGYRIAPSTISQLGEDELVAQQFWGNSPFTWMWSPNLHLFRQSEAFKSRIRSSGMLAFWQEIGWPDLCRAAGEDDFICD